MDTMYCEWFGTRPPQCKLAAPVTLITQLLLKQPCLMAMMFVVSDEGCIRRLYTACTASKAVYNAACDATLKA